MPRVTEGLYTDPAIDEHYRWTSAYGEGPGTAEVRLTNHGEERDKVSLSLFFDEPNGAQVKSVRLEEANLLDLRDGIDFMLRVMRGDEPE